MADVYAPCLCGSEKKFKFCCYGVQKKGGVIPENLACAQFPIHECKVLREWEEIGLSPVHVSRKLTNNSYVLLTYLVDFWCLGVKDAVVKFGISQADLNYIYRTSEELASISYEDARSLVLGAVGFAKSISIDPDSSWEGIPSSFIESHLPYQKKFSFGREGVPYYFAGPYDDDRYQVEEIVQKVSAAKGFFTVPL